MTVVKRFSRLRELLIGGEAIGTVNFARPSDVDLAWPPTLSLDGETQRFRKHYAAFYLATQFSQDLCTLKGSGVAPGPQLRRQGDPGRGGDYDTIRTVRHAPHPPAHYRYPPIGTTVAFEPLGWICTIT